MTTERGESQVERLQRLLGEQNLQLGTALAKNEAQEWMLRELQAIVADCPRCGPLWNDSGLEVVTP